MCLKCLSPSDPRQCFNSTHIFGTYVPVEEPSTHGTWRREPCDRLIIDSPRPSRPTSYAHRTCETPQSRQGYRGCPRIHRPTARDNQVDDLSMFGRQPGPRLATLPATFPVLQCIFRSIRG